MNDDTKLADLLEGELADYFADPDGWARQAAVQVVRAVRLAGWTPGPVMPAEEEREGIR